MKRTQPFKQLLRNGPYAWPGGYPMYAVMNDGECLCFKCAKANAKLIIADTRANDRHSGWTFAAHDINWEDASLYCAHCNTRIESAYAED